MKMLCLTAVVAVLLQSALFATTNISKTITLNDAFALAEKYHPSLAAARAEIQATEAEARQAGLLPNPVFAAEAENIAGSGELSGLDAAEYTLSLSQTVRLGGKRRKAYEAVVSQRQVAREGLELQRRRLRQDVIRNYYKCLIAESELKLAEEQIEAAEEFVSKARDRVSAGRAHKLEVSRAELALADARLRAGQAELAVGQARTALALLWGGSSSEIAATVKPGPVSLSTAEVAEARIMSHPAVRQTRAAVEQRRAEAEAAEAGKYPEIDVGIGARYLEESGDQALVFAVALPLAISDRNQGAREAAGLRIRQAQDNMAAAQLALRSELAGRITLLRQRQVAVETLEKQQLPAGREAYEQAAEGYAKGLFSSLDMLDAMRMMFEQEARYAKAVLEYGMAAAELENMFPAEPAADRRPDMKKSETYNH